MPFQLRTLKRTFEQFDSDKSGSISVETLNTILKMMGMHVSSRALDVSCYVIAFYTCHFEYRDPIQLGYLIAKVFRSLNFMIEIGHNDTNFL